ncbi:hypothetical protein R6Q59_013987 [Mikania micrantha]
MDNLINSQEDVGYLHYCGILSTGWGVMLMWQICLIGCVKKLFLTSMTAIFQSYLKRLTGFITTGGIPGGQA